MSRTAKILGIWLFSLSASFLMLVAGALVYIDSSAGRTRIRSLLEDAASDEIRGSLQIARFRTLTLWNVVAEDVTLRDAQHRKVIRAPLIRLTPDVWALFLHGTIRFSSAELKNGRIWCFRGADDLPTFIDALGSSRPRKGPSTPPTVVVDNITLRNVEFQGELFGLQNLHAIHVEAHGKVRSKEFLAIHIDRARGVLVAPYPFRTSFEGLHGSIHTDVTRGVHLAVSLFAHHDSVTANIDYAQKPHARADDPQVLDIRVEAKPVHADLLSQMGFAWAKSLRGPSRGTLRLYGPISDLRLQSALQTSGGPLALQGKLGPRLDMSISTTSLSLKKVAPAAPELSVPGTVRLFYTSNDPAAPLQAEIHTSPTTYGSTVLPSVDVRAEIIDDRIRILNIATPDGSGIVSGSGHVDFEGDVVLHLKLHVPRVEHEPNIHAHIPELTGSMNADVEIHARNKMRDVSLRGHANFGHVQYGPLKAASSRASGNIRILDSRITGLSISNTATGTILYDQSLGSTAIEVQGTPTHLSGRGEMKMSNARTVNWEASVARDARGAWTLDAPLVQLTSENLVWRGMIQRAVVQPGVDVQVDKVVLANGSQRLEAKGRWSFRRTHELEASLQDFDLAGLHAIFGARMPKLLGRADTHLAISGEANAPKLIFEGALREGSIENFDSISGAYSVTYENHAYQLDAQVEVGDQGTLSLNGSALVDPQTKDVWQSIRNAIYELDIDATNVDVRLLKRLRPQWAWEGRTRGHLHISGPLDVPSFKASLVSDALEYPEWPAFHVMSDLEYENGVLNARVQTEDEHGAWIETEGSLLIDIVHFVTQPVETLASLGTFPWRFAIRAPPRKVEHWPEPLRKHVPSQLVPTAMGFNATLAGGAFETRGDLNLSVEWPRELAPTACGFELLPRAQITATLAHDQTNADVVMFLGRSRAIAHATARTPLEEWLERGHVDTPPFEVHTSFDVPALDETPGICSKASGSVQATLDIADWPSPTPKISFALRSDAVRFGSSRPLQLRIDSNVDHAQFTSTADLSIQNRQLVRAKAVFPIEWQHGGWTVHANDESPVQVDMNLRSAPIATFLGWVPYLNELEGALTGAMVMRGTIREPTFQGGVRLTGGQVSLEGLGQRLSSVEGGIWWEGHSLRIGSVRATDRNGEINIQGKIDFEGIRPSRVNAQLQSRRFPVRKEGSVLAEITSNAELTARIEPLATHAQLTVNQLVVAMPDESAPTVQTLDKHPDVFVVGQVIEESQTSNAYPIYLSVDARRLFEVRRSDSLAEVIAQLTVTYQDPDFLVGGYAEIRSGNFEVFGKRFDVDRGTLQFDGGKELNPEVSLEATHVLRTSPGTRITVVVNGRLSNPRVTFRSNEDTTQQGEIIAMLLTGKREPIEGTDPSADAQQAGNQAASFLAGLTAGVLTLTARRELGGIIPVIAVETGNQGFQNARVRAGFQADSIIPKPLRGVVRGAYVEGFVTPSSTQDATTTSSTVAPGRHGLLFELLFNHDVVGRGSFSPPNNWGVDVLWQP